MSVVPGVRPSPGSVPAGDLPAWEVADLPAPPPFNFKNAIAVIGPGAIALGISIGSGEWLIGPSVTARYTAAMLWIATVSILVQIIFNQECVRYTMYTGEPIFTGFMRTKPGSTFWAWVYSILAFIQSGWPGWAAAGATAVASIHLGRIPAAADQGTVKFWAYVLFIACFVLIALGKKTERTMEYAQWFMIAWILIFLLIVGFFFVSFDNWVNVTKGFVSFGTFAPGIDWFLVASFAAYAGMGGYANGTISNWMRDKGFAMGGAVGYIPALVGGQKVNLSHTGKIFQITPDNLRKWNEWWRYLNADQVWVWGLGCFLGMGLPALMTLQYVAGAPAEQLSNQWAVAALQAEGMRKAAGNLWFYLTLINGFWILFSTQLGQMEAFVRTVTDILWTGSSAVRNWRGGDVRAVYYGALAVFVIWGCIAMNLAQPFILILLGAFISGFNFFVMCIHLLVVNRTLLPKEIRAPLWRELVLGFMALMFGFFTVVGILDKVFNIKLKIG